MKKAHGTLKDEHATRCQGRKGTLSYKGFDVVPDVFGHGTELLRGEGGAPV